MHMLLPQRLAAWATSAPMLDPLTLERAQMLLADYVACSVRGLDTHAGHATAQTVRAGRGGADGHSQSAASSLDAESAAFLGGVGGHCLDFDDTHEAGSLHAGTVIWPAVLALAGERGASCDAVLRAAAVGYDVMCALGVLAGGKATYERGFHPTGTYGVVGAAVAAGLLLELNADQLASAMGIAASLAGGTLAFLEDGGWTKPLHAGAAAANGIRAARLAQHGFRGPMSALDGRFGMLWAFAAQRDPAPDSDIPVLGTGMRETSIKLYPCCRYIHGILDLLHQSQGEEPFDPAQVHRVVCTVLSGGFTLVATPAEEKVNVRNQVEAQFSVPFATALMLSSGEATLEGFSRASELAPHLRPLMERVECITSPELDSGYPTQWGAAISVECFSGVRIERSTPHMRGSPSAPLTWPELSHKLAGLIGAPSAAELTNSAQCFSGAAPAHERVPLSMSLNAMQHALEYHS